MRIAILGTGKMGTGLARGWVRVGHQVILDLLVPLIDQVDGRYKSHRRSSWKLFGSHRQVADRPTLQALVS